MRREALLISEIGVWDEHGSFVEMSITPTPKDYRLREDGGGKDGQWTVVVLRSLVV